MNSTNEKNMELLINSILKIRNKQEATNYLLDILSNRELDTLVLRLEIAKMLHEGVPYIEIERKMGASSATIAKMNEALKYGHDGLRTILDRLKRVK